VAHFLAAFLLLSRPVGAAGPPPGSAVAPSWIEAISQTPADLPADQLDRRLLQVWQGSHFVVWAMVDLGFRLLASQPLVLGQVEHAPRDRSGGWRPWHLFSSRRGTRGPAPIYPKEALAARKDKGDRG
jgi:hypothetical protein